MATTVLVVLGVVVTGCVESSPVEGDTDAGAGGVAANMRIDYGEHADAFGVLWLPAPSGEPNAAPVVVLIHGGFWRDGFFLDLMDPLIPPLLERGYAVWNIEYRRVGAGGGYPATFEDVAAAVDQLAVLPAATAASVDLARVAVVGHSAGGHLAAWSGARPSLPADAVGADPQVSPSLVVSQAGVLDLVGCAQQGVGGSACVDLVGVRPADGSGRSPGRYAVTSPTEMVPFDAVVVAVHGELDRIVPTSQSVTFVDRATSSGMDATYVPIAEADHFSNLDPGHAAWTAVLDALELHL